MGHSSVAFTLSKVRVVYSKLRRYGGRSGRGSKIVPAAPEALLEAFVGIGRGAWWGLRKLAAAAGVSLSELFAVLLGHRFESSMEVTVALLLWAIAWQLALRGTRSGAASADVWAHICVRENQHSILVSTTLENSHRIRNKLNAE